MSSPYGAWVLSADGGMTLLSGGEVSTPLCPTFEEKTPEYFLGVEEGQNLPPFLSAVFRLHINVLRTLFSCELWD